MSHKHSKEKHHEAYDKEHNTEDEEVLCECFPDTAQLEDWTSIRSRSINYYLTCLQLDANMLQGNIL